MKKTMVAGLLFCFIVLSASAQTKAHKEKSTQKISSKSGAKNITKNSKDESAVVLLNSKSYPAFGATPAAKFRIADPTINALNERAAGVPLPQNSPAIVGTSKHSNGFANGHILLRTTTATSAGTGYGSGAVGTGTSIQGLGASEATLGANGKSPYAGPSLWGDKRPLNAIKGKDTTAHQ